MIDDFNIFILSPFLYYCFDFSNRHDGGAMRKDENSIIDPIPSPLPHYTHHSPLLFSLKPRLLFTSRSPPFYASPAS
jgi:hypothetical protein